MRRSLTLCGYPVLLLWDDSPAAAVCLHGEAEDGEAVFRLLHGGEKGASVPPIALITISGVDWNRDLSPWPAPEAFHGGRDFGGCADAYLPVLTGGILPEAERAMGITPATRILAGYSMAGLFALYALYKTDAFNRFASISGSLWYDGFLAYMREHAPLRQPERVVLSLGDREARTKNERLATVETCTREAVAILRAAGTPVALTMQPGGHFANVQARMADGVYAAVGKIR